MSEETKTYVFGQDSNIATMLAPYLSQRGIDPSVLAMMNNNGFGGNNSAIWILFLLFCFGGWGGNGWGGNYGKLTSGTIEANGKITTTGSLTVKGENATKLGGSLTVEGETNFNGEVKFANRISVAEGKGTSLGGSLTVGGYIDADKHALGCGRISAKGEIHGKDALALDAMTTENNSDTDDDPWDYNPVKIGTEHASFRTRKDKERIAFDYTTDGETLISVTDGIKIGEGYLKRTSYGSRLKFVDSDGNYAPIEVSNLYFVQNGSFVSLASFLNNIMSRLEALESK